MIWLYRLLFPWVALLAATFYLRRMVRRGGYGRAWYHRFGWVPRLPKPTPGCVRYWVQAVSVGEVNALPGLIQALKEQGNCEFVLSTTTSTGYALLQERLANQALATIYFPLDWWPFAAMAWRRLRPDRVVLFESELWPEHLWQARQRGVPVALVNGRLSERSASRYHGLGALGRLPFRDLSLITAASGADASQLRRLAPHLEVHEFGTLKADVAVGPVLTPAERLALRAELGFAPEAVVIAGLSTWPGEEVALATVQAELSKAGMAIELLLIPRHAERRAEVVAALAGFGRPVHCRSRGPVHLAGGHTYLADTTGEMGRLMQAADIAFIGKSLPPHRQGQTPLEAAALGIPMVFGPGMSNFRSIAASLVDAQAARQVHNLSELRCALSAWIDQPADAQKTAQRASQWHTNQRGAASKTATLLSALSGQSQSFNS